MLRSVSPTIKRTKVIRRPGGLAVAAGLALIAFAIVAVRPVREEVLRAAGQALVIHQPLTAADIIVVSLDSGAAGALEAADLVRTGISKRVAIFAGPPSGAHQEFIRRGLPYEDAAGRQLRQLQSLGVTDVVRTVGDAVGTEREGQLLPSWSAGHDIRSIVFVAAKDHSRRAQRVLDRAMRDTTTRVTVQPASHSNFDPDRWWETRTGMRTAIIELQKLAFDILRHPLPF